MDAKEMHEELGQPGAQELLTGAGLMRLAYNGPDGLPRVIPIGFLWTHGTLVVCTTPTSPKATALTERPEVALTIDVGDTPSGAKSLNVRGRASVEIVDGVAPEYLEAARKTMSGDEYDAFEQSVRQMYDQQARITITPDWARFYDFGTGRFPRFLTELAERAGAS